LFFLWSAAIHRRFCFFGPPGIKNKSGDESPHSKGKHKHSRQPKTKAAMNRRTPKEKQKAI